MDDTVEVPPTLGPRDSEVRGSRDRRPVETSTAQRTAPDLVLRSDELGGLLEPAHEERKARGNSGSKSSGESYARAHAHEFPQLVQPLRAS